MHKKSFGQSSDSCKITLQNSYLIQKKLNGKKKKEQLQAEFEVNGSDYSILIDVSGKHSWNRQVKSKLMNFCKSKTYISKNYTGQKSKNCKITDSKGVCYLRSRNQRQRPDFLTATGNFIKEVKTTMTKNF